MLDRRGPVELGDRDGRAPSEVSGRPRARMARLALGGRLDLHRDGEIGVRCQRILERIGQVLRPGGNHHPLAPAEQYGAIRGRVDAA